MVCLKSLKIYSECWKGKLKALEIIKECKSVAFENCFQIMCERDNSKRIVKHHEGHFTQMAFLVAFDSHIDQALRDITQ